jgi:hypothetical protein
MPTFHITNSVLLKPRFTPCLPHTTRTHLFSVYGAAYEADRGRGVVAVQDVAPGEVLLVCRPLVYVEARMAGSEGNPAVPDSRDLLERYYFSKGSKGCRDSQMCLSHA